MYTTPGIIKEKEAEIKAAGLKLMEAFEETFTGELIPGILHNFANPLNGIMGRAQLLQRRLHDTVARLERQYPETAATFQESHQKLISDVSAICQETDRFYGMFQDVTGKFYTLAAQTTGRINLSQVMEAELRFADYYLDFKHEVTKEIALEETLPEIMGIAAYYSLCFWSLLRHAMKVMRPLPEKSLSVATGHDGARIFVKLRHPLGEITAEEAADRKTIRSGEELATRDDRHFDTVYERSLHLLQRMGAEVDFRKDGTSQELVISVPY